MEVTPSSRPRSMRVSCLGATIGADLFSGQRSGGRSLRCARRPQTYHTDGRRLMGYTAARKKWRLLSASTQLIIHPASGARAIIRDTCADGAYRFHWSVIPSEESLPIAAGRTGGLARARSIAEEALRAYAEDWLGLLRAETEVVCSNP